MVVEPTDDESPEDEKNEGRETNGTEATENGDATEAVEDLANKMGRNKEPLKEVIINVTGLDKTERASVHQYIKTKYTNVSANTIVKDDQKCIVVRPGLDKRTAKSFWPKNRSFTSFTLYKENVDTMEAINIISKRLKIKPDRLGYAGTKDRRAKTSQRVSIFQMSPQNLFNSTKYCNEIHLGNFRFEKDRIVLGKLNGNQFHTVLREVKGDDDQIDSSIDLLKSKGFVNYYGMQRFGTTSVPTYSIGAELLKANWKEAVDLILKKRDTDTPDLMRAKEAWHKSRDAFTAYNYLSNRKHTIEALIFQKLITNPNDYLGALFKIPSKTRMLYLHSYQSYIWNCVVSRRIETYGLKVLPGDLVKSKPKDDGEVSADDENEEPPLEADFIEEFTEQVFHNKEGEEAGAKTEELEEETLKEEPTEQPKHQVHVLTAEEAENEDITNVLLPLPGFFMTYPGNEMKEWYHELLLKDNLDFEMLKTKHKAFSLGGSYRRVLVRPTEVESTICHYDDPTKPLVASDLEKLKDISVEDNRLTEGKFKAVILKFNLPPSAYATMALRELLRIDTSPQVSLKFFRPNKVNDYFRYPVV